MTDELISIWKKFKFNVRVRTSNSLDIIVENPYAFMIRSRCFARYHDRSSVSSKSNHICPFLFQVSTMTTCCVLASRDLCDNEAYSRYVM